MRRMPVVTATSAQTTAVTTGMPRPQAHDHRLRVQYRRTLRAATPTEARELVKVGPAGQLPPDSRGITPVLATPTIGTVVPKTMTAPMARRHPFIACLPDRRDTARHGNVGAGRVIEDHPARAISR